MGKYFLALSEILVAYLENSTIKEKNKYIDMILNLRKKFLEESRKPSYEERHKYPSLRDPRDFKDHGVLDSLERELLDIVKIISAFTGGRANLLDK